LHALYRMVIAHDIECPLVGLHVGPFSVSGKGAKYCDQSVCLSACRSVILLLRNRTCKLSLRMFPVAVTKSSFVSV